MRSDVPTPNPTVPPTNKMAFKPPPDGHYERFKLITEVCGWVNASFSLFVIWLHYQLGIFRKSRRATFMHYLVFAMTVCQLSQDIALGYKFQCGADYITDDDAWLYSSRIDKNNYPGKRCMHSQWFVEVFSGIMLQSVCLQMSIAFWIIVVYMRVFNFIKFSLYFSGVSMVFCVVVAATDAFGSIRCKRAKGKYSQTGLPKTVYKCPSPPDLGKYRKVDLNYFAPSNFAWIFSENLRAAMAILSLAIVASALGVYSWRLRRTRACLGSANAPSHALAITALRNKIIWYPVIQSLTRIPSLYIVIYGFFWYLDQNQAGDPSDDSERKNQNTSRVLLAYIYAFVSSSGGFLTFLLFMRNNVAARKWLNRLLRRPSCETTLAETTTTYLTSSFPEPAETEDQIRERTELLTSRCADLDEEQLVQKLAENNGRSEQAWQASLLQAEPSHLVDFVPEPTGHDEDGRGHTFSQQNYAARSEGVDAGVQLTAVAPSSHFRHGAAGYVAPAGTLVATVEIFNATVDNPLYARQHREHSLPRPLTTSASRLPIN